MSTAPLPEMLAALRVAELACRAHFQRYPSVRDLGTVSGSCLRVADPVACEADWTVCYHRREAAVSALVDYALELPDRAEIPDFDRLMRAVDL